MDDVLPQSPSEINLDVSINKCFVNLLTRGGINLKQYAFNIELASLIKKKTVAA